MSDPRVDTVHAYAEAITQGDLERVMALFADGARVEDPVGAPPCEGAQLHDFYAMVTSSGTTVQVAGPCYGTVEEREIAVPLIVRTTHEAVASLVVSARDLHAPTGRVTIHSLDVVRFNDTGQITLLRAYWGPDNIFPE